MFKRLLIAMLLLLLSGCVMEADIPGLYVRGSYGDGYHGGYHGRYRDDGYRPHRRYADHDDAGHEW